METMSLEANIVTCEVCNVQTSGEIPMRHHKEGKQHMRNVVRNALAISTDSIVVCASTKIGLTIPQFPCSVCGVVMNGPECYGQHIKSAKHIRKTLSEKPIHVPSQVTPETIVNTSPGSTANITSTSTANITSTSTANITSTSTIAIRDSTYATMIKDVLIIGRDEKIADALKNIL